ncbi:D-ribose transporter subunit; membrane component of ABC superfamily [uncultured Pleomorphomonas sp.]|uniref:Sugar ABC transporter permease n=2 Tax=Pleomorphomonas TaxID=261933 RepID=A0A2G9WQ09_9HYPH|nr:sugar ABC transporter permease [Pleomorphomonas carboxyditropha]PIO96763.1 sugar ABC transporter permease [Pleomorphomonas carboxyditropha]SCM78913.1 D-ribose transporter subunit; membrane component of ABC superfamily [uncultured Pleomorphomonas sp.]
MSMASLAGADGYGTKVKQIAARYGIYIAFAVMFVFLSLWSPWFLTFDNILNILRQCSINGIIAVGATLVIITGGIDLSVGAIVALAAVSASSVAHPDSYPVIVPILVGLAVGALCGGVNGFIIAKGRIAPFIVTLGMMTIVRGASLVMSDGRPVINLSDEYNTIGGGYLWGVPLPVFLFIAVVLIGAFLLHFCKFGRHVYAVGGNELAATVSGLNVGRVKLGVYTLAGLFAGFAGIILSSRVMTGSPAAGAGYELDAIAAVVIGGTSLAGGTGAILGTVIGTLIIGTMNNGLDLLNVSSYFQQIVKGIIIISAVLLDQYTKNSR